MFSYVGNWLSRFDFLDGWEGPVFILFALTFVVAIYWAALPFLKKDLVVLAILDVERYVREKYQELDRKQPEDLDHLQLSKKLNRRIALILILLISISLVFVYLCALPVFWYLRGYANFDEFCATPSGCSQIYLFVFDIVLKGIFIDVMESFGWSVSRIEYPSGITPFSSAVFLVRAAPVFIIISFVRNFYVSKERAQLQEIASIWESWGKDGFIEARRSGEDEKAGP